jgi:hypothetical protein
MMSAHEGPTKSSAHDSLGQTANVHHGTSTSITTPAPHARETVEEVIQALTLLLPPNLIDRPGLLLDRVILCRACSGRDWTLFEVYGVPGPSSDKTCARAQCKICRMIDNTLSLYQLENENPGRFSCRKTYAYGVQVSRTYSLTPCVATRAHQPIFHAVQLDKEALQNALPKLYPDRIDYARIRSWLDDCNSNGETEPTRRPSSHRKCKEIAQRTFNPIRVIDCRNMRIVTAPLSCDYVAVSYVWGQSRVGHSETENSTLLQDLPLSLMDSIEVSLFLGYRYIWIDRYVCTTLEDVRPIR